ncbi:MAG: FG-GAP repeat protein [Candidatus Eisenbacteria bacterium]
MHPIPTSASHRHRIGLSLGTAMLAVVLLEAHTAHASLALIREGPESKGTPESGDTFGRSVAVGDFNGDGREDLATGAPFEDVNGVSHCGCVIVNYAGKFGLKYQGAQLLLQSDGDALETGADFGWAVAAGDFDADGYDDLAIGVPTADADASHLNTGYVFVYAGGPSGLSYWHYLWQPGAGGSPESNDRFGASLCVGNFDGSATREISWLDRPAKTATPVPSSSSWAERRGSERRQRVAEAVDLRRDQHRGRSARLLARVRSALGRRLRGVGCRHAQGGRQLERCRRRLGHPRHEYRPPRVRAPR